MAYLDYNKANSELKERTLAGIREHFPMTGSSQKIELQGLEVAVDAKHADDIQGQQEAKTTGKTWSAPVYGDLVLKDAAGGVVQRKRVRLADLPLVTNRHSYIIGGQEWQVDSQWQLMPGVYTRRKNNGMLEARFTVPDAKEFNVSFDPATKEFMLTRGKSGKIPVYPLMKSLGVDDATLENTWGKEILAANKTARGVGSALDKFYRSDKKVPPATKEEAETYFLKKMQEARLRPEATQATLGKAFENVTGDTFTRATKRILQVHGGASEDDRDSLEFKDLRTIGDYIHDRLLGHAVRSSIRGKVLRKVNHATDIRDVVKFDMFNDPVRKSFSDNPLARIAEQVNPVEMLASSMQTSIVGPGGVQNAEAINKMIGTKLVNPSHLGFLDPIRTPENENTGISLRMPVGVTKVGKEPRVKAYSMRSGEIELVNPRTFAKATVALPDQVEWGKNGKPSFIGSSVKASLPGNELGTTKSKEVDYVLPNPSQLFNYTTNLIPFLSSNSGNRATYAGQHIEQAISLKDREVPLVQVSTGGAVDGHSWENVLGKYTSHVAPVAGKVVGVNKQAIMVRSSTGEEHKVSLYNNFPLNDRKSLLHSTPTVKVGDAVSKGQHIADTNYTSGGTLALGTNLRVGYIPYKGYNFEDGVVISQSAAKKLSSEHLYKPATTLTESAVRDAKKFQMQHPEAFKKDQYAKLGADGVVQVGQKVLPGDPLVLAMQPYQLRGRMGLDPLRRVMSGIHSDTSLRWESDYPGEVVGVHTKKDGEVTVHVRTVEPMQIGDKIAGRVGNKGIVTLIVDDDKMPHTRDGKHIEVALSPSGVPGRMNTGQILETAAAKVAEKTGKPYMAQSFSKDSALNSVKRALKAHGLTDQEELFDPTTGVAIGKALVGPQYMLKLVHQVDKKISARSGMVGAEGHPEGYDSNLMPAGGGGAGGKTLSHLGVYSLLAHGARANLREMQTWKSEGPDPQTNEGKKWPSQHNIVWKAIQEGTPLPTPKPTFAFKKFTDMLRGAGINVEKNGHQLQLSPLTNDQVLAMSAGELKNPGHLTYAKIDPKTGELKPRPGGLFDEKLTGGMGGTKWSHIKLPEPVPNPVFEGAIQKLTGLKQSEYAALATGEKALNKDGTLTELGTKNSLSGGAAIKHLLDRIDVSKDLAAAEKSLSTMLVPSSHSYKATPKVDVLVKKVKYLRALQATGVSPSDAYILHNVPVLPPALRTPSLLPNGAARWEDVNKLYKQLGEQTSQMTPAFMGALTEEGKRKFRASLYDGVSALMGLGSIKRDQKDRGLLEQIAGTSPKKGFFQKQLLNRRQDLTLRSTIVPEPALGLDEVGLPREKAITLYKPFVIKKLQDMGAASHPLEAQDLIKQKSPMVMSALEAVVKERPVLLKRDPALHKHSVQAFRPVLVHGKAVQIHPLVTGGFSADFDGDTMTAYVPISPEAVQEAQKMFPSNNLYNEATGRMVHIPTLESALGLYKLSRSGEETKKKYDTPGAAIAAVQAGAIGATDVVRIGGVKTTPGRVLLASALPEKMRPQILTNLGKHIDKTVLAELFTEVAKNHKEDYGLVANRLKDLGNGASSGAIPVIDSGASGPAVIAAAEDPKKRRQYVPFPVHTLGLADFEPDSQVREKHLRRAQADVKALERTSLSRPEKDRRSILAWDRATKNMTDEHMRKMDKSPTNLAIMVQAGVKPSVDQYRQMVLAPMIMDDASGKPVKNPVRESYSEGLDVAGYWTQMHGARSGTIKKVQEVRDPGVLSKQLMQTAISMVVSADDCGTARGIAMPLGSKDLHDRVLAADFKARGAHIPRGTIVTPSIIDQMRVADKGATVLVRSALKCEHGKGVCQKCAGVGPTGQLYPMGTNVGVLAAQALGERSVQLAMKQFHTGGSRAAGGAHLLSNFSRIEQLTKLPDKQTANDAVLSMRTGKVEKVEEDPTGVKVWVGGKVHHVGKDRTGMWLSKDLPHARTQAGYKSWQPPKVGQHIEAGELLSDPNRTVINPHDLYRATGNMEKVQNFLTDELHGIYKQEGVRRQHVEMMVHSMGQMTKVQDPGDAIGVLRGDFQNASKVRSLNKQLLKSGLQPILHSPVLKGVNVLPVQMQEDWIAKLMHERLTSSLLESVATGAVSNLHGIHPIPGLAYGAEFGLTRADRLKPGLGHLRDVPGHYY
jgi:DNA-directed RNA polymerase beta subunit